MDEGREEEGGEEEEGRADVLGVHEARVSVPVASPASPVSPASAFLTLTRSSDVYEPIEQRWQDQKGIAEFRALIMESGVGVGTTQGRRARGLSVPESV